MKLIGVGGEASVYDLGKGRALKVFKDAKHADVAGDPVLAAAAEARLDEHQRKLPAMLARTWPTEVVAPLDLHKKNGRIAGYVMPLVTPAEPLASYAEQTFRAGVTDDDMFRLLRALHTAVTHVHRAGVVIGDLNPYNVLVSGDRVRIIDADSQQFDRFMCRLYTDRYTDPRLLEQGVLAGDYDSAADWYTFAALVLECLAFVTPFGGVHRPKQGAPLTPSQRLEKRVTVFDPDVLYPRAARPLSSLPPALHDYLRSVFVDGVRGEFPAHLLERIVLAPVTAAQVKVAGIDVTRLFVAAGPLVDVAVTGNNVVHALWRDGRTLRREDGSAVPQLGDARVLGKRTAVLHAGRLSVDAVVSADAFAAHGERVVWAHDGALFTEGALGAPMHLGDVLAGATKLWLGPRFGIGFYLAGEKPVAFTFSPERRAVNDSLMLPRLPAILSAHAVLSDEMATLTFHVRDQGVLRHHALCFDAHGGRLAEQSNAEWQLARAAAVGRVLFVPTDEGVLRVEPRGGQLCVTARFPNTREVVNASSRLHIGHGGLVVQNANEVLLVRLGG